MHQQVCLFTLILVSVTLATMSMADDEKHKEFLKNFVPDHPHLHELVDQTHKGDLEAKHRFERESLSVRFNQTKSKLPPDTDDQHVVLHFLDEYNAHVTGQESDHKFMELEPFIDMLGQEDDLREKLIEIAKLLEKAECDYDCLGKRLTEFMNESVVRMMARIEL